MRISVGWAAVIALGLSVAIGMSAAEETKEGAAAKADAHQYIGVDGCKLCHKTEKSGDQYGKWLASPHAKAYELLASDEAKEVAKKAGVEGDPQKADQCLQCHVTAHGVKAELLGAKYKVEDGVGCESCHGAGADYKSKKVMEDKDAAVAAGLIIPTEATCTKCHNEKNPTHKGFDYKTAVEKIAHPTPK
ncbi:MAG: cytochrome c3 family protein [Candidatus Eisenbacteria bacterium]|uniref:Cytochrome c3 family protein n=1 Tax=Eiseniibacteriota bacterium TaxID=2212470 RepID=A0A956RN52_UNCEI|nr:cytochrome c3 family protein [Candidatus Eisenbacteria bacterium]